MSNQEELNRGNGGTPRSAVEFTLNFQPQTEDQLIEYVATRKELEENGVLFFD